MLTIQNWELLTAAEKEKILTRATQSQENMELVHDIIAKVRSAGDEALFAFTQQFDGVNLSNLLLDKTKIASAAITTQAMLAIKTAINNITAYHQAMLPQAQEITTVAGVRLNRVCRPINKVGLYVPGGNTPLISSVLMQAIPALLAGCQVRILCTPPNSSGEIDPHVLVAARLCGIEKIYTIGGAQAIAAMAYGTHTIPKVDKIFGPGNAFVTAAKSLVAMDPAGAAIDMLAGPSEVMIIADDNANPNLIAADLLAQAEHGPDSQVLAICSSHNFAEQINTALVTQFSRLVRKDIILLALAHSNIIVCKEEREQLAIINAYAPEHLILHCHNALDYLCDTGIAAGTIFVGPWAAETLGDYVTGSNHILPTNGFAKNHSGLTTSDFMVATTVQTITQAGFESLAIAAETLASLEGLDAHASAVKLRMDIARSNIRGNQDDIFTVNAI